MSKLADPENAGDPQARAALLQMVFGYMPAQVINVAARLGVADLLRDGAKTGEELAAATGTHAPSLHRLLRALACVGVLAELEPGRFELTPLGAPLRADAPNSVRALAMLFCDEVVWRSWGSLRHSVQTGQTAFEHIVGMGPFEYFARNPELSATFNAAMAEDARNVAPGVVAGRDFSRFRTLVDVGGGDGTLIAAILRATPGLRGVLFDTPAGVDGAPRNLEAAGVADRCRIVAGDFFESVPDGGDAYLLKSVVHDWDDDRGAAILGNCRRAMPADGAPARRAGAAAEGGIGPDHGHGDERPEHAGVCRRPRAHRGRVPGALRVGRLQIDRGHAAPRADELSADRWGAGLVLRHGEDEGPRLARLRSRDGDPTPGPSLGGEGPGVGSAGRWRAAGPWAAQDDQPLVISLAEH